MRRASGDDGVLAERLLSDVGKTSFLQAQVAGGAAVHNTQFRQPNLMNSWLEAPAQADCITAIADESQVFALIAVPLAEVLFCRRDSQRQ